ncbi:MAG TPA: hypothetical protein VGE74_27560 [Gemmata sp.]
MSADKKPKGQPELTFWQVIDLLSRDRAGRQYALVAVGALAMIFLVMFMNGSDLGGLLVVVFGAAALVLRWTAAPPFLLLIVAYFQVFPFGFPDPGPESPGQVYRTQFQVADMVLVMAALVYLRAQYRIFGLVHQIVPFESTQRRKGDTPTRRPTAHIRADEIAWLLGTAGALVLLGQGLWWLVNALEFVPLEEGIPLRWAQPKTMSEYQREPPPGEFRPGASRFFVILGGLFFGSMLLRLVFGYWRLRMMTAAEGAMVLTDTSWAQSHRERVRVEKWRVWGWRRAKTLAEEAERAEQARQAKAEREAAQRAAKERARRDRAERDRERAVKRASPVRHNRRD